MKRVLTMLLFAACGMMSLVAGCDCDDEKETVDTVSDVFTGTRAVRQGEELKKQVRGITGQREEQAEGVRDNSNEDE